MPPERTIKGANSIMWQRFTERARRVILLGQEEAGKMNSGNVGTEHLLLGLVREDEGVAAQVLVKMGVTIEKVRAEIEGAVQPVSDPTSGEPKLTPKAKRVLELAADEARRMRHNYVGTEHLLLALLRETDGLGSLVLREMGLNLNETRAQVLEYLGSEAPLSATAPTNESVAQFRVTPAVRDALNLAMQLSREDGAEEMKIAHLLRALCQSGSEGAQYLETAGIDATQLEAILWGRP